MPTFSRQFPRGEEKVEWIIDCAIGGMLQVPGDFEMSDLHGEVIPLLRGPDLSIPRKWLLPWHRLAI